MTTTSESVPKDIKALPEAAQRVWVEAYNRDFAWRCSEAHAAKAAWRAVITQFQEKDGTWVPK